MAPKFIGLVAVLATECKHVIYFQHQFGSKNTSHIYDHKTVLCGACMVDWQDANIFAESRESGDVDMMDVEMDDFSDSIELSDGEDFGVDDEEETQKSTDPGELVVDFEMMKLDEPLAPAPEELLTRFKGMKLDETHSTDCTESTGQHCEKSFLARQSWLESQIAEIVVSDAGYLLDLLAIVQTYEFKFDVLWVDDFGA